jgi:hypothetical protein
MAEADRLLGMYLHLARASRLRQQPLVQVKLLVLAGVQAEEMGLAEISALCRHKILAQNARHLLGKWPTMAAALAAEPFRAYLKQLRRRYSSEKVEHMVHSLGIEMGRERQAYFSDAEYAAALLDTKVEAIAALLAQDPRQARNGSPSIAHAPPESGPRWGLRELAIVWGPFVAGLAALAALFLASRKIG